MQITDKKELRDKFIAERNNINNSKKELLDKEITARFLMSKEYRNCDTVLLYMAKDNEISTLGIFYAALANKKEVAFPKCFDNKEMKYFKVKSLSDFEIGYCGILEPKEGLKEISDFDKALCVTPCFCVDFDGHRVGHGAGFYDKFFDTKFKGEKVALAYTNSVLHKIDYDKFDVPVNIIVTDTYIRNIKSKED